MLCQESARPVSASGKMSENEESKKAGAFSFGFSKTKGSKHLKDSILKEKDTEESKTLEFVRTLEENRIER